MIAPHCAADIAPVPESVSRSISTSSPFSRKTLWPASTSARSRSARSVNLTDSTVLIRNGSMIVLKCSIAAPLPDPIVLPPPREPEQHGADGDRAGRDDRLVLRRAERHQQHGDRERRQRR